MIYKVKPTIKQVKALGHFISNGGNVYQAMIAAGYSKASATSPPKLTSSRGWQELIKEHLDDNFLLTALEDDIRAKPKSRHKELELAFKIKGRMKSDDTPSGDTFNFQQNNFNPNSPGAKQLADDTLKYLMEKTKRKVIE